LKLVEARRAKATKARAEKVATMTPAERELFERRSAAMRGRLPGPKSGRERQRQQRKNAEWLQELLAGSPRPAKAKRQAARVRKTALAASGPVSGDPRTFRDGVFA
jgi:hypothetical protein